MPTPNESNCGDASHDAEYNLGYYDGMNGEEDLDLSIQYGFGYQDGRMACELPEEDR